MMRPRFASMNWWLIHCRLPSNVSLQCRTVTAPDFQLRVSITDRCNERCTYCHAAGVAGVVAAPRNLKYEETLRLIRIAAELGVSKVRITGGEPLTRRGILDFVKQIPEIPPITSMVFRRMGPCSHAKSRPLRQWRKRCAMPVCNR